MELRPPLHFGVVTNEKGAFGSLSTKVANSTYFIKENRKKLKKDNPYTYKQPLIMAYEKSESARDNFGKFIPQFQAEIKILIRKLERILMKLYIQNGSLLFNQTCLNERLLPNYTHTHTHTHTYIYIYIYIIKARRLHRIPFLSLSFQSSLSYIAPGRSPKRYPESIQVFVSKPRLACPCEGVHRKNVTYKFVRASPAVSRMSCSFIW